jgi:hypothetical protein
LREIRLAAVRRYPHAEPALLAIEDKHVPLAGRALQAIDAVKCELHAKLLPHGLPMTAVLSRSKPALDASMVSGLLGRFGVMAGAAGGLGDTLGGA